MTQHLYRIRIRAGAIALGLLALGCSEATWALVEDYQPTPITYVLYTFSVCGLIFLGGVAIVLKIYRWLHYALLAAALVLVRAASSGALPYWLGGSEFSLWVVPYLVFCVATAIGYWVAGTQLQAPHRFARYRSACFTVAVFCLIGPLTSYFWLKVIPLNLMWLPQLVLFYAMFAVLILPPWTWTTETRAQKISTRAFPFVTGLPILLLPFFEEPGYGLQGDTAQKLELLGISVQFVYVWVLTIWLGVSAQTTRLAAERRALEAAKNEAELQLALRDAEQDYENALAIAQRSRQQLASVSHDLKQPLTSLRIAVDRFASSAEQPDSGALSRAVDYVEDLARAYSGSEISQAGAALDRDPEAQGSLHPGVEAINMNVILESLAQMFATQAAAQNIELNIESCDLLVDVSPLDLMRVLSNLIANALQHAEAETINVSATQAGSRVMMEVTDNGKGLTDQQRSQVRVSGNKGQDSNGDGLGLAIVADLAEVHRWDFTFDAQPGKGATARLSLPIGAS